ncbi:NlpC/P60 family protein [Herbiconiux sp. 11R-BC]|uniref:C40 family peptidase n=1 Tax=Herbiconiux sp. 11R-BC TaxID=3111637 RepID=UPI003C09E440
MAPYGETPETGRNHEDPKTPESPLQPLTRRELRSREVAPGAELELAAPPVPARRAPSIRMPRVPRLKRPTKKSAVTVVVMTFAAGLIATMALPAYAFGGGGSFDQGVATSGPLSGAQTLQVPADASAALAVSRDNYTAPTTEQLAASREAAAAAVAATEAANNAAAAAATAAASGATANSAFTVNPPSGSYSGAAIIAFAQQFVGVVPYGSGASPDTSFGCDGLTQYVFGAFGIYLPRTVSNQAAMGIPISPADAQAGDLMIYPIGHVGIYDGAGGMIDSPDWGRYVEHRPVWGSYYFVRIVA